MNASNLPPLHLRRRHFVKAGDETIVENVEVRDHAGVNVYP